MGTDTDASMTAFCLIAMQESKAICSSVSVSDTHATIQNHMFSSISTRK